MSLEPFVDNRASRSKRNSKMDFESSLNSSMLPNQELSSLLFEIWKPILKNKRVGGEFGLIQSLVDFFRENFVKCLVTHQAISLGFQIPRKPNQLLQILGEVWASSGAE